MINLYYLTHFLWIRNLGVAYLYGYDQGRVSHEVIVKMLAGAAVH